MAIQFSFVVLPSVSHDSTEGGWPLGLQPLNVRLGLARNHDYSGSISFNTTLTASPTSSADSSSDLDTQSTGSFFHDKSVTLGSLIGVSSILEMSKRSVKGRKIEAPREKRSNTNNRSKVGLFSLCSRDSTDAEDVDAPSLGHFLTEKRRAAGEYRRTHSPTTTAYGPDELALAQPNSESNTLFVNGCVAPPRTSSCHAADDDNNYGVPVLFSCMCGQPSL
ncbi:hypothetical protein E1A91_A05G101400v1 [Gossypium mustelinum]|uniref:Uncharacterized protein n=3 Tax=Gossypium TaxID=3633 RepID=A0A5J5VMM9_GOSBA|nr:hypothetical protein ES319_A05G100000v1 [Gossypium barbadense]TYH16236.1 hypothetical protein ES288_A05G102100v1 [Gossypium darwinii]TYJ33397.1 hypothetical protein E1A91_A05G101400v1 [Gossypium mustelinum]